ncbi:MAG: hypothetical protein WCQ80_02855 [Bacilli bacterium]
MKTLFNKKNFYYVLGIAFIGLCWSGLALWIHQDIIFPTPWRTFHDLGILLAMKHTYVVLMTTLWRLFLAVGVSFILALVLGGVSIRRIQFASFIRPQIALLKTIPVASIIIILLVLIGHEYSPLFITGFVIFPILYEAVYQGFQAIDNNVLDDVRMLSGINTQVIQAIYLPLITPFLFTGLVQSLGLGLKVMIMSEFISQPTLSIGREMLFLKQNFEMGKVFAWTFLLIMIIMVLEWLLSLLKQKIS